MGRDAATTLARPMELQGRVALITGGTSGIGFATATAMLEQGATVAITGRDDARLAAAAERLGGGERLITIRADSSLAADADRTAEILGRRVGRLDILFANAGVGVFKPLEETPIDEIQQVVAVNLVGVILTVKAMLPLLADGSTIILNASWTIDRGVPGATVYSAAKAGVRGLAQALAAELAPRRIRVNSISPGYVKTETFDSVVTSAEQVQQVAAQVALGRVGAAEEIADAVLFLASEKSRYVTAIDLGVDGGLVGAMTS
jgi:NAD(P)-dependent dehydrogenase (short-subunit alcohol dehydrogenase family)